MKALLYLLAVAASVCLIASSHAAPNCDPLDERVELTPTPPQTSHAIHRHMQLAAAPKHPVDIVLFGDSLVENWPAQYTQMLAPSFVNLGIAGDRVNLALWRLANGDWSTYNPHTVVLLLGTNDLDFIKSACAIAVGLERVVQVMHKTWPAAIVEIIDILPRGRYFQTLGPARKEIATILRADLASDRRVGFVNVDGPISCDGNSPCPNYVHDFLHLTPQAYNILASGVAAAMRLPR